MRCVYPVTGGREDGVQLRPPSGEGTSFLCLLDTCLNKRSSESSFPGIRRGRWEEGKVTVTNRWLLMTCRWRGSRDFLFSGDRVRKKEYSSTFFFFFSDENIQRPGIRPSASSGRGGLPRFVFFLVVHFPSPLRDGVRRPLGEEQGSVGYRIVRNPRESPSLEQQGTLCSEVSWAPNT